MAVSIYDIPTWATSTAYALHTIVSYNGTIYYAIVDVASSSSTPDTKPEWWGGTAAWIDGVTKPFFLWRQSYNYTNAFKPQTRKIQFGDGYLQKMKEQINNNLTEFDLSFDGRSLFEATAILHFLKERQGSESFLWVPTPPFATLKLFFCEEWTATETFFENWSIKAKFIESVN